MGFLLAANFTKSIYQTTEWKGKDLVSPKCKHFNKRQIKSLIVLIPFRPCVSEIMVFDSDDTEAVGTAKVQIAMRYVQHILLDFPSSGKNDKWDFKR